MDETFGALDKALTFIGVPFCSKFKWESKILFVHQIFNYVVGVLTMASLTAFMVIHSNDSILLIEGARIWSVGLIMFVMLTLCLVFRYKFRIFLEEMAFEDTMLYMPLVKCAMDTIVDEDTGFIKLKELKQMVVDTQTQLLRYTRLGMKMYMFSTLLMAILYICDALYQFLTRSDDQDRPLGFPMWFPWSLANLATYAATFICHSYAGCIAAAAYPAFQCTVMFLIGQVIRQLKVLAFISLNLSELGAEWSRVQGAGKKRWQLYSTEILTQCVKHYVLLKRFSNRLNTILRYYFLVVILNAIMFVCFTSVKIAMSDKTDPDTIKYYLDGVSYVFMVMIHCLLGQKVENQCEKLQEVVTEKWYIFNQEHKKSVLIFKMALGQGMPIYIFGSVPLSLPTFTWFLKTGMSFFTLVMSVMEEE